VCCCQQADNDMCHALYYNSIPSGLLALQLSVCTMNLGLWAAHHPMGHTVGTVANCSVRLTTVLHCNNHYWRGTRVDKQWATGTK
jgi:hypothetical protein